MQDVLAKILKSGVRTSEFWVMLVALFMPFILEIPQDQATTWAVQHGGAWAGYIVAAVYIAARAYIKGKQLQAIGPDALADSQARELLARYPADVTLPGALPPDLQAAINAARAAQAAGADPATLQQAVAAIVAAAANRPGSA